MGINGLPDLPGYARISDRSRIHQSFSLRFTHQGLIYLTPLPFYEASAALQDSCERCEDYRVIPCQVARSYALTRLPGIRRASSLLLEVLHVTRKIRPH